MPAARLQHRGPERSLSWPPPICTGTMHTGKAAMRYKGMPGSASAMENTKHTHDSLEDDQDSYAEDIFLSPIKMYEYEDWASDSDDEADEVEWDAGITDFALFDSDRRQAEQSNEKLPSKWNEMLENQTSALARAIARERAGSDPGQSGYSMLTPEDLPSLTPDNSPNLRDSLDIDSYHGQNAARPSVPNYLKTDVEEYAERQNDLKRRSEEESSASTKSVQLEPQAKRRNERPGLRHSRTMSGQVHAWTPPSRDIYTLGEEPDAERSEEFRAKRETNSENDAGSRGRRNYRGR